MHSFDVKNASTTAMSTYLVAINNYSFGCLGTFYVPMTKIRMNTKHAIAIIHLSSWVLIMANPHNQIVRTCVRFICPMISLA
ncbi:hypothetical protein BLOT_014176 [Blomia tropicalis]|nr:hypothetical protein BLOT_014176 [Blomia tropicalis]